MVGMDVIYQCYVLRQKSATTFSESNKKFYVNCYIKPFCATIYIDTPFILNHGLLLVKSATIEFHVSLGINVSET